MTSPALLAGRVALVTGGASGIGRAVVSAFVTHGAAAVLVADLSDEQRGGGPSVVADFSGSDTRVSFVRTDVTDPRHIEQAVSVAEGLGGLTTLVNCAGVFRREVFLEVSPEAYDQMFAVNVRGTFFACQAAARAMRDRGGVIINLASVASYRGSLAHATYHASKGAVQALTYALARDLASYDIRVNAIHPGAVDTDMLRVDEPVIEGLVAQAPYRLAHPARPQDVADAVVYLASDLSSHVSGTSLTVDGGAAAMG